MINTISALELCQRALLLDGADGDALSLKSYLVAFGLNDVEIELPEAVLESYKVLVAEHGLRC